MALLVECPECKARNSTAPYKGAECRSCKSGKPSKKPRLCKKCGFALAKFSGRVWWIEYYDHDKRLRREGIGSNKAAAEQRYPEVMSARTEGRFIKKSPDAFTLFKALAAWYLDLPAVKAKRSYDRDERSMLNLFPFLGDRLISDITPALVEAYRQKRLPNHSGAPLIP